MSGVKTRPPARRATASTKRASPGSSPSMKMLSCAPERRSSSTCATVARTRLLGRRPVEGRPPVDLDVGRRLAVGDDEHDRLGVGVPPQVPRREHQRVLEVGALHPLRLGLGELGRREPRGPRG